MKDRVFSLKPWPSAGLPPHLDITGSIRRSSNMLSVSYALSGPLAGLMIQEPADIPLRKNRLWEETCLELFLAPVNSERYWEFNLSTSGHWNIYRFTSYRAGMHEETAFRALPLNILLDLNSLQLSLEVGLERIVLADQALKVGISAVIKAIDGTTTFWALAHPGLQPDFHRRDSFIIDV